MGLALADREVTRVRLIDDNPAVRNGYRYAVEDLSLQPVEDDGPLGDLATFIQSFDRGTEAIISDFQLKSSNYSPFNGDELVALLYTHNIPAVLCTKYADVLPEPIRSKRRHIPVVLKSDQLDAEGVAKGFELCVREFAGEFLPTRRPWRAIVRIEGVEQLAGNLLRLNFVLPGWDLQSAFSFEVPTDRSNDALKYLADAVGQSDLRTVYASVNLGAERSEDIYITDWSLEL